MNDEDRKFLTDWGGGCWHEFDWAVGGRRCKKCGEWDVENRTFDTWEDFGWLTECLIHKDIHEHFIEWYRSDYNTDRYAWWTWEVRHVGDRCQLICDFLREQEVKG